MGADAFHAVIGDRRGSGRVDPPDRRWWRGLDGDPGFRVAVEVLDDCFARGLRWMEIAPDEMVGPWRLYVAPAPDAPWTWGDDVSRDLCLLDYQRDRIMQLWEAGELLVPPSNGVVIGGWLWEL